MSYKVPEREELASLQAELKGSIERLEILGLPELGGTILSHFQPLQLQDILQIGCSFGRNNENQDIVMNTQP